jgi:hypothetical protein
MQHLPQHTQFKVSEVTVHGKASELLWGAGPMALMLWLDGMMMMMAKQVLFFFLSSVGDSKLYILQYSGRAELTNLDQTKKAATQKAAAPVAEQQQEQQRAKGWPKADPTILPASIFTQNTFPP